MEMGWLIGLAIIVIFATSFIVTAASMNSSRISWGRGEVL
jgi:hypothetical protein